MTPFDGAVVLLVLLFVIRGAWVGLIGQLAFLTAMVLGFMAAGAFHGDFVPVISPWVMLPQLAFLLTYLVLFAAAYLATMLVGRGLRRVMSITLLAWFDRLTGGILGAVKALFVASLIFMGLAGFLSGARPMLRDSLSYPFLAVSSGYILLFIGDHDLRDRFLPREPAIAWPASHSVDAGEAVRRTAEQIAEDNHLVQ